MRVLVINQCSTNKGDRAVLYFVLRELQRHGCKDITVTTSSPEYWSCYPDIPAGANVRFIKWGWDVSVPCKANLIDKAWAVYYKRKFKRRVHFPLIRKAFLAGKRPWYAGLLADPDFMDVARDCDFVVSTGGHHITTIIAGDMCTPQVFEMELALMYGKPLLLWSQTIGSFEFLYPENKKMIQKILTQSRAICIRDIKSEQEIMQLGVNTDAIIRTQESVFGLADEVTQQVAPSERPPVFGISVWTGRKSEPSKYRYYVECMGAIASHAVNKGYSIQLFPMELGGADRKYLQDIAYHSGKPERCSIIENWPSTCEHINMISNCRMYMGHKTHSVIFSLATATPLLGIAYHEKTRDFMRLFNVEENCIDEDNITLERLIAIFDYIDENLDELSAREGVVAAAFCQQVKKDFGTMLNYLRYKF